MYTRSILLYLGALAWLTQGAPLNINLGAYSPALVVGDGEISFGGGEAEGGAAEGGAAGGEGGAGGAEGGAGAGEGGAGAGEGGAGAGEGGAGAGEGGAAGGEGGAAGGEGGAGTGAEAGGIPIAQVRMTTKRRVYEIQTDDLLHRMSRLCKAWASRDSPRPDHKHAHNPL